MLRAEYIELYTLGEYFTESKRTVSGNIVLALAVFYILFTLSISAYITVPWIMTMLAVSVGRMQLAKQFKRTDKHRFNSKIEKIQKSNYALLTFTSILWSVAFALIMYHGGAAYDLIALMILIGYMGSSIMSAGVNWPTYLSLNLISSTTSYTYFLFQDHPVAPVEFILSAIAIVFIFLSAYRFSEKLQESLGNAYDLQQAKQDVIQVLGRAGEYRDEETGNHILRMSHSCYLVAKQMGYSEEHSKTIQNASTLHDVGKIGIPDRILLKPGKLDKQEMQEMQTHTLIGCEILGSSESPTINMAKKICLSHHEKWNGQGYPNHLKGDDIPIEGRIAAVCDVFDALTSERAYKQAWSEERAIQYIKDNSGTHFDPQVVESFLAVLPEIRQFKTQHL